MVKPFDCCAVKAIVDATFKNASTGRELYVGETTNKSCEVQILAYRCMYYFFLMFGGVSFG